MHGVTCFSSTAQNDYRYNLEYIKIVILALIVRYIYDALSKHVDVSYSIT